MEIAQKIINSDIKRDEDGNVINPIDAQFRSLQLESMLPIEPESKEFAALVSYATDSHGKTHSFRCNVQAAFRVRR